MFSSQKPGGEPWMWNDSREAFATDCREVLVLSIANWTWWNRTRCCWWSHWNTHQSQHGTVVNSHLHGGLDQLVQPFLLRQRGTYISAKTCNTNTVAGFSKSRDRACMFAPPVTSHCVVGGGGWAASGGSGSLCATTSSARGRQEPEPPPGPPRWGRRGTRPRCAGTWEAEPRSGRSSISWPLVWPTSPAGQGVGWESAAGFKDSRGEAVTSLWSPGASSQLEREKRDFSGGNCWWLLEQFVQCSRRQQTAASFRQILSRSKANSL